MAGKIGKRAKRLSALMAVAILAAACSLLAASCANQPEQGASALEGPKYPPGTSEEMLVETTGSGAVSSLGQEKETGADDAGDKDGSPGASVELAGVRFTLMEARRTDSNAVVVGAGQPEVPGDYLEMEVRVENVSEGIVDLSEFSFRLWSPGINAHSYQEYYGADPRFGKYVSDNMVSLVLLDYATLKPASRKLKAGETLDGAFLFCDLNPTSVERNQEVVKETTNLVVRKQRGAGAGGEAEINLAAYTD